MNGYQRQKLLDQHGLNYFEDFIIGLVYEERVINIMDIIQKCIDMGICSYATAHKNYKTASDKGYLSFVKGQDHREKRIVLSTKAVAYLEELK